MRVPRRFNVAGVPLRCKHCDAETFFHQRATIDRLASGGLFHHEAWLGRPANIYVCGTCGFLHWFFAVANTARKEIAVEETAGGSAYLEDEYIDGLPTPGGGEATAGGSAYLEDEYIDGLPTLGEGEAIAEVVECLACGRRIPAGETACPECGWSWIPGH
jgi:hypothetical protein